MNFKKNTLFIVLLLLIVTILPNKIEAWADEITKYDINMKVNENNTFNITENITVKFIGNENHGIYRKIPLRNKIIRLDGTKSQNTAKVSNIETNIRSNHHREDGFMLIEIGDPDVYVAGSQDYEISYLYNIGKDTGKRYDELYFNLIGNDWDVKISNITFTIEMPKEFDESKIGFSSGYKGTVGSENVTYSVTGNTITGSYNDTLKAGQSLTIRIELPNEYFVGASSNFDIIPLFTLILPILFVLISFNQWKKYGKDEKVIETVEFYPPEGYNSAEIGFLYKGYASETDAISLLVYLANKGYIKITENEKLNVTSKGFTITKLKDYDGDNEYEKIFLEGLFNKTTNKNTFINESSLKKENSIEDTLTTNVNEEVTSKDLEEYFHRTVGEIYWKLNNAKNKEKIFNKDSLGKKRKVLAKIIISLTLITFMPVAQYSNLAALPFAVMFPFLGVSLPIIFMKSKNEFSVFVVFWGLIFGGVPFISIVLPGLLANSSYLITYILGIICVGIMSAIYIYMPKRTEYGNQMLGRIKGFKDFLETAEKPKLEELVMDDPTYFYEILPFTYVLGVSDKWMKKFESIAIEEPTWYSGSSTFNVSTFSTSMNSTMASAKSSMSSSSSGGSSGGGSSGGGSGGGGGGSW